MGGLGFLSRLDMLGHRRWGLGRRWWGDILLRIEKTIFLQNSSLQSRYPVCELSFDLFVTLKSATHRFDLRIEIIEVMEQERFQKERDFRRAELELTMVAEDHMLKQHAELRWKVR